MNKNGQVVRNSRLYSDIVDIYKNKWNKNERKSFEKKEENITID